SRGTLPASFPPRDPARPADPRLASTEQCTALGRPSAFRQLQLDAAVALVGFLVGRGVERLEFGKAGGDQPLRGYPEKDQILHHGDGARRRQLPVRLEQRRVDWPGV